MTGFPLKMKISVILLLSFLVSAAQTGNPPTVSAPVPATPPVPLKAIAAVGSMIAQSSHLTILEWDDAQIEAFVDGVRAAFRGKPYPMDEEARQGSAELIRQFQEIQKRKSRETAESFAQPGRMAQYMKDMRKRYSLQISDSGLAYNIQPGRAGARPRPGDTVVVSCIATAADTITKLPQLSNDHARVKMANLLPGFMEGLQMMSIESQARFILPPELSFGEGEWPEGVDRGTPLLFLVTLHEVIGAETAP